MMKHLALGLFFCLPASLLFSQSTETGLASVYHDSFDGSKTCTNEKYDKTKLTAAHKSIPAGTTVRVTNLSNNKVVEVRINDCGPYIKGQIIELSRAAGQALGIDKSGATKVKVEVLGKTTVAAAEAAAAAAAPAPTPPPVATAAPAPTPAPVATAVPAPKPAPAATAAPAPQPAPKKVTKKASAPPAGTTARSADASPAIAQSKSPVEEAGAMQTGGIYKMQALKMEAKGFGVQIAGYSDYEGVMQQLSILQKNWFKGNLVYVDELNGKPYYKVILGPFFTREEANSYAKSYKEKFKGAGAFVVDLSKLK